MKEEITIPVIRQEGLIAAIKRSERYSLVRDLQAREFNDAIATRLAKDKQKQEQNHEVDSTQEETILDE